MSRILKGESGQAKSVALSPRAEPVLGGEISSFQRAHSSDFVSVKEAQEQANQRVEELRDQLFEQAKEELQEPLENLKSLVLDFSNMKAKIYMECEEDIVDLLQVLSKKLFSRELSLQPDLLAALIKKSMLEMLKDREIEIKVNPKDSQYLQSSLQEIQEGASQVRLIEDLGVTCGSAQLVSRTQKMTLQMERIIDSFFDRLREEKSEIGETGDEGDKL